MIRSRLTIGLAALLLLGGGLLVPADAHAHSALRRSVPAAGAELDTVPRELRLTFSEPVTLSLARLRLEGPGQAPVALGDLRLHPDSSRVLLADVAGRLEPGEHTVHWMIVGADGHPVRGDFRFTVRPGAEGLAPPPAPAATADTAAALPPGEHVAPDHAPGADPSHFGETTFDAESPLYAVVRWLNFLGLLGVVGAVAFRALVLPWMGRGGLPLPPGFGADAARRAARVGLLAALLLAAAAFARLVAQSYALHGSGNVFASEMVAGMLLGTLWGWGWIFQAVGTGLALLGLVLARAGNGKAAGWIVAGIGAAILVLFPGLSGHAAGAGERQGVALLADAVHVLGAGGWLGTLFLVVAAGLPAAARLGDGERARAAAALVRAFSPVALLFASVLVVSGVVLSWVHLGGLSALWGTEYGRVLLLKLAVLSIVVATGAYNWRRVLPRLGEGDESTARLRRSAMVELGAAVVVLAVTAVLVATPTPHP